MALTHQLLVGGAAVLLGAASGPLVAASPAVGASPGAEGLLAYVAQNPAHEEGLDIYTIAPNGTGRTNLTNHPARDQDPAWSPDGTQLAFSSTRDGSHLDIWVVNADGSGLRNLTPLADSTDSGQAGTEPAWSPDGTKIAYVYQGDVWVMDAATGAGKQNLTHDPAIQGAGISPAWSPDGTTIAYVRGADIWMMGAGGGNKRQLTTSTGGLGTEKYPDWSPDGLRLVYERSGQIWTMNRNGTQQTAIAAGLDKGGTNPAWSPEGDWVVFSSSGYTAPAGPDLFLARPDGTSVRRVPNTGPGSDVAPAWQPLPTSTAASTYATATPTVTDTRVTVRGELFNANPGQLVRVDLQRHDGAVFRPAGRVDATLTTYGDYAAGFANPASTTTCRVIARYLGDADSLATTRTAVFAC
ncbi:TolB family protein [Nocardioides antri]|uniref:Dipeptidylpeptidase IV N-terminal domain-containing protein n=1 Tax=Nocardioides antri TaxID=2607659 RepID=A0A5B1LZM6_9ACTN|nr:DPP IV N-terminal domain-containing protein [Nocardioides antri]KAA1426011.1 hypothetical protein F0U47_16890 [Nocardioides antri]